MHQCYEVAKTPRPPPTANKAKEVKGNSKGKGKEKQLSAPAKGSYDYHDGSVSDIALRMHFQRGYEEFKVGGCVAGSRLAVGPLRRRTF